ncbi:MAG TPA: ribosome biogenesis GTP-binding protein YihA/YsxC [Bacteroidales bacterium]|jgi:GTP-binding protein|nr:ribosome biogenesis GTP-binding protein YihA/YsxC [Bacteroidales bacterium]
MEITTVKFIKSSPGFDSCPREGPPEYAFAGRSNVGKSSLLNLLMNIKNLAKISSRPGKTRLINHYLINDNWYLVDLPGYGFAKAGKTERDAFVKIIEDYIMKRNTLACLFILIDSRHKPLENDLEFIKRTGSAGIPLALVFTKTDKQGKTTLQRNIDVYKKTLKRTWEELPPVFLTSSVNRTGREEILAFIDKANKEF